MGRQKGKGGTGRKKIYIERKGWRNIKEAKCHALKGEIGKIINEGCMS